MYKKLTLITTLSFLTLGLTACGGMNNSSHHRTMMHPGSYENTSRTTDKNGTIIEQKMSTDMDMNSDGSRRTTTTTKTTRDPKGMFNKRTTSETKETTQGKY